MELANLNVLEDRQRIRRLYDERAVEAHQVGGDRLPVDAHEADRQARALLAGKTRLVEADNALTLVADAQQQDLGLAVLDPDLVGRDERQAAPGEELRAEEADGWRRDAAAGAFAAEGRDGIGMGQEETRALSRPC